MWQVAHPATWGVYQYKDTHDYSDYSRAHNVAFNDRAARLKQDCQDGLELMGSDAFNDLSTQRLVLQSFLSRVLPKPRVPALGAELRVAFERLATMFWLTRTSPWMQIGSSSIGSTIFSIFSNRPSGSFKTLCMVPLAFPEFEHFRQLLDLAFVSGHGP